MNKLESIKETIEEYINADKTFGIYDAPDFTDDVIYLLQRLERYEKALKDARTEVWNEYVPATLSAKVHRIVEEALKE